jgi:hypothetical protein
VRSARVSETNNPLPGSDAFRDLLDKFRLFAADALESGDPDELHNAAIEAAQSWNIRGVTMRRVLAAIARERPEFKATVLDWKDADAQDADGQFARNLSDEQLNELLARHAIHTDWENASVARELYRVQIAAKQAFFSNKGPLCVLSFKRTANGSRSSLRIHRNGLGLKFEINLNLDNIGKSRRLCAVHVVHELLHLREALFENREPTGSYHSKCFLDWATKIGIPTTSSGNYLGVTPNSPVDQLFRYLHIPEDDAVLGDDDCSGLGLKGPRQPRPKLKRLNCGCTEIYAEANVTVAGRCEKEACGNLWQCTDNVTEAKNEQQAIVTT